jgi:hypothetical protein
MYVVPAVDHSMDVHRFLNLDTKHIILSRDVKWLKILYVQWVHKIGSGPNICHLHHDELDDDENLFPKSKLTNMRFPN